MNTFDWSIRVEKIGGTGRYEYVNFNNIDFRNLKGYALYNTTVNCRETMIKNMSDYFSSIREQLTNAYKAFEDQFNIYAEITTNRTPPNKDFMEKISEVGFKYEYTENTNESILRIPYETFRPALVSFYTFFTKYFKMLRIDEREYDRDPEDFIKRMFSVCTSEVWGSRSEIGALSLFPLYLHHKGLEMDWGPPYYGGYFNGVSSFISYWLTKSPRLVLAAVEYTKFIDFSPRLFTIVNGVDANLQGVLTRNKVSIGDVSWQQV